MEIKGRDIIKWDEIELREWKVYRLKTEAEGILETLNSRVCMKR